MPKKAADSGGGLLPLQMRVPRALRERVEGSAKQSGRSLANEAAERIQASYRYEDLMGGGHIAGLANMLGLLVRAVEARTGKSFTDDPETRVQVGLGLSALLESLWGLNVADLKRIAMHENDHTGVIIARALWDTAQFPPERFLTRWARPVDDGKEKRKSET